MTILWLTLAALATSVVSGMTGLGGGTILIAILYSALPPAVAVPVHASVQLVSNGARTVAFLRHVRPLALVSFLAFAVPCAWGIARLLKGLDPHWARVFMGVFLLLTTWTDWLVRLRLTGQAAMAAAGVLAGGLGMVIGATGALIAPFFLQKGWSKETIIGTKALCQGCAHLVKMAMFGAVLGFDFQVHAALIVPMALATVAGTYTGKAIVGRLSEVLFRRLFRGLLTILALQLMARAAWNLVV